MKIIVAVFALISFLPVSNAQIINPVKWSFTAVKVADKTFDIHLTATLEDKWHIYSQEAGEGPVPTSFTFMKNPLVKLEGKVKEVGNLEESFDPNFNSTLKFFDQKVDFVQRVKTKSAASTLLKGEITYMTCNDKKCLPPKTLPFSVKLSGK